MCTVACTVLGIFSCQERGGEEEGGKEKKRRKEKKHDLVALGANNSARHVNMRQMNTNEEEEDGWWWSVGNSREGNLEQLPVRAIQATQLALPSAHRPPSTANANSHTLTYKTTAN